MTARAAPRAMVLGCAGTALDDAERRFMADADPAGFILFKRNCESPAQTHALIESLREAVGRPDAAGADRSGGRPRDPAWASPLARAAGAGLVRRLGRNRRKRRCAGGLAERAPGCGGPACARSQRQLRAGAGPALRRREQGCGRPCARCRSGTGGEARPGDRRRVARRRDRSCRQAPARSRPSDRRQPRGAAARGRAAQGVARP